ncbi:MAG: DUF2786 domain-containing protein [Myxococcales bacterium]|nr:DUF2786 domain-containing protein [Myxococcales bacterium]
MRPPTFALIDSESALARWAHRTRTIELSRALVLGQRWTVVVEVLKHEMAHQFVDEVLLVRDETAHGPLFQKVCRERGIDARAAGLPDARHDVGVDRSVVLGRVAKLLALAQSPDEHEAQTAMKLAQKLMLEHNLSELEANVVRSYVSRELGEPMGKLEESVGLIGVVLREHFFVEVIQLRVWRPRQGSRGTVLEVTGTPENVSMAEYVYSFLHHTAEALWSQHKRAHEIKGDRDRRAYRAGVITGFLEKLRAEQRTNEEKGLVWVGDPALEKHYRARYPRISTVRTGGAGSAEARSQGHEAGRKLVLRKGVEGATASKGLALGDGKRR